jgi:spore coat protein U-like protein
LVSGSSINTTIPVYGRLTLVSTAPPGSYSSSFTGLQAYVYMLKGGFTDCSTGTVDGALTSTSVPFSVTATVPTTCNLTTVSLSFGTQTLLNAQIDAGTTIGPQCTNGTPYSVTMDNGQTGTSPTNRKMTAASASVTYGLYSDAARTTAWGTSTPVSGTGTGVRQTLNVYGRVPVQTTPAPGTYNDSVVVTVTF